MSKTAIIYVRVSDPKQARKELPIESQIASCEEAAERLGAAVLRVFEEAGHSAFHGNRRVFEQALKFCEKHRPHYFITWDTDRFSRRVHAGYSAEARLEDCGTELVYASFDVGDDPDQRLLTVGLKRLMGEMYSRSLSKNVRRSLETNAKNGFWKGGTPPFGYELRVSSRDSKKKELVPEPYESKLVLEIYNLRLNGAGCKVIAENLNERRLTRRGKRWSRSTILSVLKSRAVLGQVMINQSSATGGRRPKADCMVIQSHPAIVDEKKWLAVQRKLAEATNKKAPRARASSHLLTGGLLVCGECGASMKPETATGRSRTYEYYNCQTALSGAGCQQRRISAPQLDDFIASVVSERILELNNLRTIAKALTLAIKQSDIEVKERASAMQLEVGRKRAKVEQLLKTIEAAEAEGTDSLLLLKRANELESDADAIETEMLRLREEVKKTPPDLTDDDLVSLGNEIRDIISNPAARTDARPFMASVITRVIIDGDAAKISYRPDLILEGPDRRFRLVREMLTEPRTKRTKTLTERLPQHWRRGSAKGRSKRRTAG